MIMKRRSSLHPSNWKFAQCLVTPAARLPFAAGAVNSNTYFYDISYLRRQTEHVKHSQDFSQTFHFEATIPVFLVFSFQIVLPAL
jgi:hypothetical protein